MNVEADISNIASSQMMQGRMISTPKEVVGWRGKHQYTLAYEEAREPVIKN